MGVFKRANRWYIDYYLCSIKALGTCFNDKTLFPKSHPGL